MRMLTEAYSAFRDSSVVKEPAPARRGNTIGTSVAALMGPMFLKISTSSSISRAIKKMTSAPATANDSMSTLKRWSMASPAKKNPTSSADEISVAWRALTGRPCCLRLIMIGVDPNTSITAKRTTNAPVISWRLNRLRR